MISVFLFCFSLYCTQIVPNREVWTEVPNSDFCVPFPTYCIHFICPTLHPV